MGVWSSGSGGDRGEHHRRTGAAGQPDGPGARDPRGVRAPQEGAAVGSRPCVDGGHRAGRARPDRRRGGPGPDDRRLPGAQHDRRGGHGFGLPGPAPQRRQGGGAGGRRRHQGDAPPTRQHPGLPEALRAGGDARPAAQAPRPGALPRPHRRRRHPRPRDGVGGGRAALEAAGPARSPPPAGVDRADGGAAVGDRVRPRPGRRAPRHQAGQHHRAARRGRPDPRLRHRQGRGQGGDEDRQRHGHAGLHGARADGGRQERRRPGRPLRAGRDAVRDARRSPPLGEDPVARGAAEGQDRGRAGAACGGPR